jgi:hypothetical protein
MSSSLRSSTCVRMLDSVDPPRNWIKSANANWKGLLGSNTEYFFYVLRNDPTSIPREDLLHVFLAKKNETDGIAYFIQFFKDVKDFDLLIQSLKDHLHNFNLLGVGYAVRNSIGIIEEMKQERIKSMNSSSSGSGRVGQLGGSGQQRSYVASGGQLGGSGSGASAIGGSGQQRSYVASGGQLGGSGQQRSYVASGGQLGGSGASAIGGSGQQRSYVASGGQLGGSGSGASAIGGSGRGLNVGMSGTLRQDDQWDWCDTHINTRGVILNVRGENFGESASGGRGDRLGGSESRQNYDTTSRGGERGSRTSINPFQMVQNQTNYNGSKQPSRVVTSSRDDTRSEVSSRFELDDEDQDTPVPQRTFQVPHQASQVPHQAPQVPQSKAARLFDMIMGKPGCFDKFKRSDDVNQEVYIGVEEMLEDRNTQEDLNGVVCFSMVDLVLVFNNYPDDMIYHFLLEYCNQKFGDFKINATVLHQIFTQSNRGDDNLIDDEIFKLFLGVKYVSFTDDAFSSFGNYPTEFIQMLRDRVTLINSVFPNPDTSLTNRHGWK